MSLSIFPYFKCPAHVHRVFKLKYNCLKYMCSYNVIPSGLFVVLGLFSQTYQFML